MDGKNSCPFLGLPPFYLFLREILTILLRPGNNRCLKRTFFSNVLLHPCAIATRRTLRVFLELLLPCGE